VEILERHPSIVKNWRILNTPPMPGVDNMRYDAETLAGVERGEVPPTLRFFRFAGPTVTFGRLQNSKTIAPLVPQAWDSVQRPTGGGLVFHQNDLCLSLCWPKGKAPLPRKPQDQYRWIHSVILQAMPSDFRMSSCCETPRASSPFEICTCFTNPVGHDIMRGDQKIVGGALSCKKEATLYQGSIQTIATGDLERRLLNKFQDVLV
jgi:lipoate-protein ligase A